MIAITPGEPAGIGPDLVIKLAQQDRERAWIVVADKDLLLQRAKGLGLPLRLDEKRHAPAREAGVLTVLHRSLSVPAHPGRLDVSNASYVIDCLDAAIDGCMTGEFSSMVTGPVQKSVIAESGLAFMGHTEYLAERSGAEDVVMMLANDAMRVALATTHLPLAAVPAALSKSLLRRRLLILHNSLTQRFGIASPRILVAGLNPHAGEDGRLGQEEQEVIEPICEDLRREGLDLLGPLPADTLFTPKYLDQASAVMAMYHDQGLPVLKYAGFGKSVNITLGLPFVRTSVDHGTALDLAGTGQGDEGSFRAAIASVGELRRVDRAGA